MKNKVIYIAREFGSGGRDIGKIISKTLGFKFYDSKLVDLAAGRGSLTQEKADYNDERGVNPWLFFSDYTGNYQDITGNSEPELMFKYTSEIIKEKAAQNNCVFVGRCADYILKDDDVDLIKLFVYAPVEWRIQRLIETEDCVNEHEARNLLRKKDRQRSGYYSYFTGEEYRNPLNYDLCINSSFLGVEKTAFSLCEYCKNVFKN